MRAPFCRPLCRVPRDAKHPETPRRPLPTHLRRRLLFQPLPLTRSSLPHPPHIHQEVPDQLFRRREFVAFLDALVMPVVAFPWLIVVQHKALARPAVEQAVFEAMPRTADGAR